MSTPVILSSIGCKNDVLCDFPAPQSRRRGTSHSASGHTLACACTARPLPHTHEQSLLRGSKSARRICLAQPPETSQIIPESSTSGKASSAKTSRQQVFASCSIVSAAFAAAAAAIRLAAPVTSPYLFKTDQSAVQTLLHIGLGYKATHALVLLATAGIVTGARSILLTNVPSFEEATNASNKQVLTPLKAADLIWLSCLPGVSEELLFRGALIPGTFPDWRGAVLSAVVFGALHNSGGRNWTFAAWAGAVGLLYGAVFLQTQDLIVPMGAHCLANYASATLWLRTAQAKDAKPE